MASSSRDPNDLGTDSQGPIRNHAPIPIDITMKAIFIIEPKKKSLTNINTIVSIGFSMSINAHINVKGRVIDFLEVEIRLIPRSMFVRARVLKP